MNNRSSVLVLATALVSCLAVALCAAFLFGGYWLVTHAQLVAPLLAPAALNRIVYVGNDGNIYVADPITGDHIALTQDGGDAHAYNYPTWAPDNHRIAFVGYTIANGALAEGALYTVSPRGENLTPVFKTQQNFPFYLYWSPDSQFIGFLSNKDAQNIALRVAHTDQPDSMQELDTGSPFYWAWSPDGAQLFTHVGGARADNDNARLAILNLQNNQSPRTLTELPGAFQAPQWSRDGKILFSTQDGSTQAIALTDTQGKGLTKLASYNGRASFALAPDGTRVAYIVTDANLRVPHYGFVHVVNADATDDQPISPEPALAFQWSPDSKKIAFLTLTLSNNQQNFQFAPPPFLASNAPEHFFGAPPEQQGGQTRVQLNWKVWDSTTTQTHLAATFVPTDSFLNVLPYFDQYANSTTFWSPDSEALVYTTLETNGDGSVWTADIAGKTTVKKVGDGVLAFWSWR
jgi:TolB protein